MSITGLRNLNKGPEVSFMKNSECLTKSLNGCSSFNILLPGILCFLFFKKRYISEIAITQVISSPLS